MRQIMSLFLVLLASIASAADGNKVDYPPTPEAFSSFGAAVADGHVYVYGGHVAKTHTYSTEAVTSKFRRLKLADPKKGWQELPEGPGLQGLALVAHQGKIYRIGGMQPRNKKGEPADNVSTASFAVFDPHVGKWQNLPDLPAGRSSHDAVVVGDKIVVAGGWQMNGRGKANSWHDTALMFDLADKTAKWQEIAQPFKRRALNLATVDNKVYVLCGMGSDNGIETCVDILDMSTKTWSRGPAIPGAKRNGFTPAACSQGSNLYLSPSDGEVYRLSSKRDSWEPIGTLEKRRVVHRIVPAGPVLLVLGGASAGGNIAAVEAIVPRQ